MIKKPTLQHDYLEGHTIGIGPLRNYMRKVGRTDLGAEVKWLPELDVRDRLKGDIVWVGRSVAF